MDKETIFISYGHNVFDKVVTKLVADLNKENLSMDAMVEVAF